MNWVLSLALLLAAMPAFAAETGGESRFHLLSTRCEAEADEGPETTPQSPPLEVDDPSTPGCNRWEINVVADGDVTRSQRSWELPLLDINYGIGDNIQLKYEVPYVNNASPDSNVSAIGESRAGIKHLFFEDERSKLQLATYPQLSFVGSRSDAVLKGLASPGSIVTLPMLLAAKIGETSRGEIDLTANLGYNLSTKADTADFVSAAMGVGTPLTSNMAVMGAVTTEQAVASVSDGGRAQLVRADVGVMAAISRQFLLFGSIGHSVYASDTQDHTYALAGFRVFAGGVSPQLEKVASRQGQSVLEATHE